MEQGRNGSVLRCEILRAHWKWTRRKRCKGIWKKASAGGEQCLTQHILFTEQLEKPEVKKNRTWSLKGNLGLERLREKRGRKYF